MTEIKYSNDFYFPSLNNEQHYEEPYNTSNSYKGIGRICHQSIDKHNHYADELYIFINILRFVTDFNFLVIIS